jgi:general secretion pathway protein K
MSHVHRRGYRGAALIVVLWLVASLALVVLAAARSTRVHVEQASLQIERLRAQAVLDGIIALTAQRMLAEPDFGQQYQRYRVEEADVQVAVEITPGRGLVDVTVAQDELLTALLRDVGGASPAQAQVLTARIRDWLDLDDQPGGVGGAEAPQYRAAAWPTLPRNGGMEDPSELLSVLGMPPQLYEKIRPFLGIDGRQRIDLTAAPPALIDRLTGRPGLGAYLHGLPPERREAEMAAYTASNLFEAQARDRAGTVRLRARVAIASGRWWEREVWIDRAARPDTLTPWTTLMVEPVRRSVPPGQDDAP